MRVREKESSLHPQLTIIPPIKYLLHLARTLQAYREISFSPRVRHVLVNCLYNRTSSFQKREKKKEEGFW